MDTLIAAAPVTFTPGAIKEIHRLMNEEGFDTSQALRVGVKGGGCSGMTYVLGFEMPEADDKRFEVEGIPCMMNSRGFTFSNPNASKTCGCGTSFSV